ncbi:MAG: hypothetical protein KBF88_16920, partial [Polyangiaceae bacterium]|nr:hypothetical protein [Polyangiaceae bacterium]
VVTATELESVRKALRRVRPVATPAACPTDGPSAFLEIHRQSKPNVKLAAEKYIDEQNSCFVTGHVAATNLPPVALLLGQLAAVGSSPAKCAGPNKVACAKGSTCFRNGAFPDAYGTCAVDTGVVCEALATCDPNKAVEVKACAPGASCYYSSICSQEILCQNKPVAPSKGKCGGSSQVLCKEGESCMRNGAYPDASGTCVNLAEPQCAALALCDPNKEKQVSACGAGASCNYVSQCGMEILCQTL